VRFEASVATIRRDFNQLARTGLVRRVRGGIQLLEENQTMPFAVREVRESVEKMVVARKAVGLLRSGNVVFVDGGTTTLQLASCLPTFPLRLITNSLSLAAAIENRALALSRLEVFLTGGYLPPGSGLLVGPRAQAGIAHYHADWALVAACGINEDGIFNDNEHVVESERMMISRAEKVAVLVDHTKIEKHGMCKIADLESLDMLITDEPLASDSPLAVALAEKGVAVM